MENLTFVVYGMNGRFYDEITFSAYENMPMYFYASWEEMNDYIAMMCGL